MIKENIHTGEHILESLASGIISVSQDLTVTYINNSAEKILGISRNKVIAQPLREIFSKNVWLFELMESTLKEHKHFSDYEGKILNRLSKPINISVTTNLIIDEEDEVTGATLLFKDISGLKAYESESVKRKERLIYLGTFVANLAHEVRNPLGGIKGAAQLLERKLKDDTQKEYTEVIIGEADRLNSIVEELLDFTKPLSLNKKEFNIHKAINHVIKLSKEDKLIERIYDPSIPAISGDENKLIQVFLNFVKNALEATNETTKDSDDNESKKIQIKTSIVTDFNLLSEGGKSKKLMEVEFLDFGKGIDKEEMDKIYTPFYTTKKKGSGLGIPISYMIIKEHGGFLRINSDKGKGTSVKVFLPLI